MVAVLFARHDSIYKTLPGCDVWDFERDARNWPGGCPVIAHPPCRAWGQMSHFATPGNGERELAIWAVEQVRKWGGVLEHPAQSKLWPQLNLPTPGQRDEFGGYTVWISQWWFGHRADKPTRLYIVGCEPSNLPEIPFKLGEASHVIASTVRKGQAGWKPHVTKAEREHTPLDLALWLRDVALRVASTGAGGKQQKALALGKPEKADQEDAMSRIYFHSEHGTAEVRGSERADMGRLCGKPACGGFSEIVKAIKGGNQ